MYLAKGHFDMQTGGTGNHTTNLPCPEDCQVINNQSVELASGQSMQHFLRTHGAPQGNTEVSGILGMSDETYCRLFVLLCH